MKLRDLTNKIDPRLICTDMYQDGAGLALHMCVRFGTVRKLRIAPLKNGEPVYEQAQVIPKEGGDKVILEVGSAGNWLQVMNILDRYNNKRGVG